MLSDILLKSPKAYYLGQIALINHALRHPGTVYTVEGHQSSHNTAYDTDKGQVLGHYKNLLAVEAAFGQLKGYLEVRPVYHFRPDRVRNHVRLCFLAYWLCARLGQDWQAKGKRAEVPRLLHRLQSIRMGTLRVAGQVVRRLLTQIPAELNAVLERLGLLHLFGQPPPWAQA